MSYSIREMRKEEYSLLSDFLYEAIYIPDGTVHKLASAYLNKS